MKLIFRIFREEQQVYEVTYGPKQTPEAFSKRFDTLHAAQKFYTDMSSTAEVQVYVITTLITKQRLDV